MAPKQTCVACKKSYKNVKYCPSCGSLLKQETRVAPTSESKPRARWSKRRKGWTIAVSLGLAVAVSVPTALIFAEQSAVNARAAQLQTVIENAKAKQKTVDDALGVIDDANNAIANTGSFGGVDQERQEVADAIAVLQGLISSRKYSEIYPSSGKLQGLVIKLKSKDTAIAKAAREAQEAAAAEAARQAKAAATAQWTLNSWSPECTRLSSTRCKIYFNLTNSTSYPIEVGNSGTLVVNGRNYNLQDFGCWDRSIPDSGTVDCSQLFDPGATINVETRVISLPQYETLTFGKATVGNRLTLNLNYNWG